MYEELRKNPSTVWTGPVPADWPLDVQIEDERGVDLMQLRDFLALTPTERIHKHHEFRTTIQRMWESTGVTPHLAASLEPCQAADLSAPLLDDE